MRFFAVTLLLAFSLPLRAYSVLTHEAIIDRNWPNGIRPLLLGRFPQTTDEQLKEAHAYVYGGAILQDMGYYPFGSKLFSDLLHYVRSGDYIQALIRDAQDVNEYAFALGALAHYAADNAGHPVAVNRAVPKMYPKLQRKFGNEVTYEDNPAAHLRTEFGFDVIEVARGKYASESYHDFIGFRVSKPVMERAFEDTYSFRMKDLFKDEDLALGTFRFSVSQVIPEMTKAAWSAKKKDILQLEAGMSRKKFVYRYSRTSYNKDWDSKYERPGFGARLLAFLFRIVPKIGPFKALAFRVPTPEVEKMFIASFDDTKEHYHALLEEVKDGRLQLQNENFDTGRPTRRGDYKMADESYSKLLDHLEKATFSPELRANILAFYQGSDGPDSAKARAVLSSLRASMWGGPPGPQPTPPSAR
ncbi:MAG TPA: zinc dependent phospholipase C family protein [Bryobacteraceae bacterium]|nr:zinc dependent phospholipase C family protein [Bryobacteraceae bacterium]